jgi:hypothetical protein
MVGISMGTALIGSAIIGGASSALAGSKNSKAINKSTEANAAANTQNVALQRDVYNRNTQNLSPFMARGNVAGDTMNALLGLGGGQQSMPTQQPTQQQYMGGQQNALTASKPWLSSGFGGSGTQFAPPQMGYAPQAPQQMGGDQSAQQAAGNAFDIFRNSTGYQFRLDEGMDALNSGYAGAGVLQSGDALRAATEYGQNFASNEFGNYMGYLGNQQGVGLAGASAVAGVGQNYANNLTALNNQNAQNITNSAVAKANNTNSMIGGIGGAFGNALGGMAYGNGFGGGGGYIAPSTSMPMTGAYSRAF